MTLIFPPVLMATGICGRELYYMQSRVFFDCRVCLFIRRHNGWKKERFHLQTTRKSHETPNRMMMRSLRVQFLGISFPYRLSLLLFAIIVFLKFCLFVDRDPSAHCWPVAASFCSINASPRPFLKILWKKGHQTVIENVFAICCPVKAINPQSCTLIII